MKNQQVRNPQSSNWTTEIEEKIYHSRNWSLLRIIKEVLVLKLPRQLGLMLSRLPDYTRGMIYPSFSRFSTMQ